MKFIFSLLLILPVALNAELVDKIIAVINNEIITVSDIANFEKRLKTDGLIDESIMKPGEKQKLSGNRKAILDHLIKEKLLDHEVKQSNLSVTIELVEQEIRRITQRNGITREQLISALKGRGVKFSDYQDFVKKSLERRNLIEKEISSKIKITDEEISDYFAKKVGNKSAQVYEYEIAHILIRNNKITDRRAQEKAESVLEKINSGESFDELASQFSEDPNFSQGGVLGTFKAGEMLKEFEASVKALKVGEVTQPIKTKFGFHLVKLNKKKLIPNPKLKQEEGQIQSILFAEAFQKQFENWLESKKREAFIRIN